MTMPLAMLPSLAEAFARSANEALIFRVLSAVMQLPGGLRSREYMSHGGRREMTDVSEPNVFQQESETRSLDGKVPRISTHQHIPNHQNESISGVLYLGWEPGRIM